MCSWCYIISAVLVLASMGYKEYIEPMLYGSKDQQAENILPKGIDN